LKDSKCQQSKAVSLKINDLETPALLVDREVMDHNLRKMQAMADSHGVSLRPHTKTHKCPEIAKLQLNQGAGGICVQKLSEAEVMVEAGVKGIFITNEIVQPTKINRLVELQDRACVRVAVDSLQNAQQLGRIAAASNHCVPVLVDVDTGMKRCGVPLGPLAIRLANRVHQTKGLRFDGLMTFEGHLCEILNPRKRKTVAQRTIERFVRLGKKIRQNGIDVSVLSCGSTPTAEAVAGVEGVTEIQPGNYVFYDLMQVERGSARLRDCAQRILTTVISSPTRNRCVVDAGSKAFVHDHGKFPKVLGDAKGTSISIHEEHLTLRTESKFRIGDKVQFIAYHACTATNMFEQIHVVKGNEVIEMWPVAARGKMA
jgi:D-serine deaminase-like pyridoxal phosphate-dependent protein